VPDLQFHVEDVSPMRDTATPQLAFKLCICNAVAGEAVHSVALRCQVQIEPVRRRYEPDERERLLELFGEPERWSQTLRPLLWANLNLNVPGFTGTTHVDLAVPCTFDFDVAMTKYAYVLEGGELPVSLLFSGTVFHAGRMGLQIAQIPWDREASVRVPVQVWKDLMELHYPKTAWLRLERDVFERLYDYKARHGIPTWEQVMGRMLADVTEVKS
jgi:uncharacterized protein DUF6084